MCAMRPWPAAQTLRREAVRSDCPGHSNANQPEGTPSLLGPGHLCPQDPIPWGRAGEAMREQQGWLF